GFAEAMGGTLNAEDTPGGGLTMVLGLPAAAGNGATAVPAYAHERVSPPRAADARSGPPH
ncbi:hypothetical protein ACFWIZ_27620, partial [Streptomyces sp. NPDC127044]